MDATKVCSRCQEAKPLTVEYFPVSSATTSGFRSPCHACKAKAAKQWREDNREHRNQWFKDYRLKRKQKAVDHYGGKCVCCGVTELVFLTFDHVLGGGTQDRRDNRKAPHTYEQVIKSGYPDTFQVLCWNCNAAKHFSPTGCPHQRWDK